MSSKNKRDRDNPDPGEDGPGGKRSGGDFMKIWSNSCGFELKDAIQLIQDSGPDMDVPENVLRYIQEGKLKMVICVSGGALVGAAIYGIYKAGDPPTNFPHADVARSQMYFVGVRARRRGVGTKILKYFEEQSVLANCELAQIIPAKKHLICTFYKQYSVDESVDGGAFLSKRLPRPPPPPLHLSSAANTSTPKPWQAFLSNLQKPAQEAPKKPAQPAAPKSQKPEGQPWASFMATLKNPGKDAAGNEGKKENGEPVVAGKEKEGDEDKEENDTAEDSRATKTTAVSGYMGSLDSVGSEWGPDDVMDDTESGAGDFCGQGGGNYVFDQTPVVVSRLSGYAASRDTDGGAWDAEDLWDTASSKENNGIASFLSAGVAQGARLLRSWWGW